MRGLFARLLPASAEGILVVVVALATAALVALGAISLRAIVRWSHDSAAVAQAHATSGAAAALVAEVGAVESEQRGFTISGDEAFLSDFEARIERAFDAFRHLREIVGDGESKPLVDELEPLVAARIAFARRLVVLRRNAGFEAARNVISAGEGRRQMDAIQAAAGALSERARRDLSAAERRARATRRGTLFVVGVGGAASLLFVALAAGALRGELARRRRLEQELAEASQLQRAVLDGAELAIIAGYADCITLFNRGAERLLGYRAEEVVGRASAAIFHDPDEVVHRAEELTRELGRPVEPGMETILAKARSGGVDEHEWTYLRKDGGRVPVHLALTALRGPNGEVRGFLGIAHDIGEPKRAHERLAALNEELRRTAERAQAADRVKSAFLATMSHELRTPLNSILGFTGILLQELPGALNAEQRKQLGMVQASARHLLALINDVLDISKIEAGELRTAREPFDLRASVARVAEIVAPLAERKGLALRVAAAPEIGDAVGDARRVEQVLLNLLNNAVKFTERGAIELRSEAVAAYRSPAGGEPGPAARLSVADTGIGIASEELESIFEPFRQVESGLTRNHDGTGLGLAICRRLARLMGGEIVVESRGGVGSTFSFVLPLRPPEGP